MSNSIRSRRSSQPPPFRRRPRTSLASESTSDSYYDRRDGITTNDAPEWQSKDRYTSVSRRPEEYSRETVVDFNTPSVKPSDSVSRVSPRTRERRKGATFLTRWSNASSNRPLLRRRHSSEDGSRWSKSWAAPLTMNNLENLNDISSESSRQSRRPSRRTSSVGGDTRIENWRQYSGAAPSRSIYAQDDLASQSQAKSAQQSATSRRQSTIGPGFIAADAAGAAAADHGARRRTTADDYDAAAQSRVTSRRASQAPPADYYEVKARSRANSQRASQASPADSHGIAARSRVASRSVSQAPRVDHYDTAARSRVPSQRTSQPPQDVYDTAAKSKATSQQASQSPPADYYTIAARSKSNSRRTSQAPPVFSGREIATAASNREELDVTRSPDTLTPYSSMQNDSVRPWVAISHRRAESPPEMEWERRVRTREYQRPSDGKMVLDRECLVRRVRAPQAARLDSVAQA